MLAPYPKQRYAMIDFAGFPQPRAGLGAAPLLQPPQQLGIIARRVPKPPRDHARRMPARVLVGAAMPQVFVPAEPVNRLPAHAAETWPARKRFLAVGRGRSAKADRQILLAS